MLIWGVHVHVGMPDRDRVMPVLTSVLNQYPHLLALSASSPLWAGTDTGYASNRALMFQQLPTAGLPFQFTRWEEFERFAEDQTVTGVIDTLSEIRWDVRPASHLGTIENRICDGVSDLRDLTALVALVQCLVVDLDTRLAAGETLPTMPPWHVQENKWRAARYGLDAIVILDEHNAERLVTDDLADLVERLAPTAERLGCPAELAAVNDVVARGASYQRQRRVAERTGGDLVAVVDSVVASCPPRSDAPRAAWRPAGSGEAGATVVPAARGAETEEAAHRRGHVHGVGAGRRGPAAHPRVPPLRKNGIGRVAGCPWFPGMGLLV